MANQYFYGFNDVQELFFFAHSDKLWDQSTIQMFQPEVGRDQNKAQSERLSKLK